MAINVSITETIITASITASDVISVSVISQPINISISAFAYVNSPSLVNPSTINNFVSFINILGGQKDSGYSPSSFALIGHVHPGGGGVWGTITGDLSDQLDLQAALDTKLSSEIDPIFSASPAFGIDAGDISNWNSKLSTESDPIFLSSVAAGIDAGDIAFWDAKQPALGYTPLNPANNLSELSSVVTARSNLGLEIGVNVQAYDANLTTWALKAAPAGTVADTAYVDAAVVGLLDFKGSTETIYESPFNATG